MYTMARMIRKEKLNNYEDVKTAVEQRPDLFNDVGVVYRNFSDFFESVKECLNAAGFEPKKKRARAAFETILMDEKESTRVGRWAVIIHVPQCDLIDLLIWIADVDSDGRPSCYYCDGHHPDNEGDILETIADKIGAVKPRRAAIDEGTESWAVSYDNETPERGDWIE